MIPGPAREARAHPFGLMAVLATVVMLFTAFTASYLIRRTSADWRPVSLPPATWVGLPILAAAGAAMESSRRAGSRAWLGAAAGLGLAFLAAQACAWSRLAADGVLLASSPHASFFYMLSAVHGLHLLGGLAAIGATAAGRLPAGSCAAYWHVVGGAWVWVLILLSAV